MGRGEAMTLQEKLESAANLYIPECWRGNKNYMEGFLGGWHPDTDDGDSRRLEIACLNWMRRQPASNPFSDPILVSFRELEIKRVNIGQKDDTTPEQYRAAVLDLAAAIGEVINAD